jgi:hypothetical protein
MRSHSNPTATTTTLLKRLGLNWKKQKLCPIQVNTLVTTSTTAKPIRAIKANRELT